jgi:hypothetical protein
VRALLEELRETEPLAYDKLHSEQPEVGRAAALAAPEPTAQPPADPEGG